MKHLTILACALLIGACQDDSQKLPEWTPADHEKPASLGDSTGRAPAGGAAEADLAKTLYRLHCASCHGAEGRGDGPMASGLTVPDLTSEGTRRKSDEALMEVIRLGGAGMPPFGGSIGPEGTRALVEHIRELAPPEAR